MNFLFNTIIENGTLTGKAFFIATFVSLAVGLFMALIYSRNHRYTKSFIVSLVLLPAIVQMVIMLVNGNIGAGVAVAGAFSLVRFRSATGTSQEITSIFLAMAVGLATGMGYIAIAVVFAAIITLVNYILSMTRFGEHGTDQRVLRITIPEDLDFEGIFDDLLENYTVSHDLAEVKTSNMGSLYKLEYNVIFRQNTSLKELMDQIRQRNGNLEVSCSRPVTALDEL